MLPDVFNFRSKRCCKVKSDLVLWVHDRVRRHRNARAGEPESRRAGAAQVVARGVQGLVGAVLFAAAVVKAAEPSEMMESAQYLLPIGAGAAWAFLIGVIVFEVLLGSAMLAGLWVRQTLLIACAISIGFLAWGGVLQIMDAPIGCGCGTTKLLGLASTNRWASMGVSGGMFVATGLIGMMLKGCDRTESRDRRHI